MPRFEAVEIVRIRPQEGAEARLMELRPRMIDEYRQIYGDRVSAQLFECEDGTWVDVWSWETRALAEDALANTSRTPAFEEWVTLVDDVAFDWGKPKA